MAEIRILHVITHLGIGGAQDNTLSTVGGLALLGYDVHLATGLHETEWLDRARLLTSNVHIIGDLRRPLSLSSDLLAFLQLMRLMREKRFDIVHTHSSKAGILGRLAARLVGVPIIVHTVHGLPWHDHMSFVRRTMYQFLERGAGRHSTALITVSENNRDEVIRRRIAPPLKVVTIHSGIGFSRFDVKVDRRWQCAELGLDPDKPIVGSVARLFPQKAPLDYVMAARLVRKTIPDAQFILVGDGPLREEVVQAARDVSGFRVLGSRDDIPQVLSVLDVFALSSLWEGLGRAITEAMYMGLSVAGTAVNGVPELVEHEVTGLLSPPGQPALLAANIVRLLQDRDLAGRLAKGARSIVGQWFSEEAMVERIESLYFQLLERVTTDGK